MFSLSSVEQVSNSIVRVTFTSIPVASFDYNINDALNPDSYSISGPGVIRIDLVAPVSGDSYSFDLYINGSLTEDETWTLSVNSTLEDVLGEVISETLSLDFIGQSFVTNPITGGAANETAEQVLRRYINPKLKGKVWNALIAALATGEQYNWDNAAKAFDQLFISSASDKYLEQRGSDYGVRKPVNVGISDDLYRKYIKLIKTRQLTLSALNEMLEVFYGVDGTHPFIVSGNYEPYVLGDDWEFHLNINGEDDIVLLFDESDFNDINAATALEVCTSLNKSFELFDIGAFALPYENPSDGEIYIKIVSSVLGTSGLVEVTGGRAQNSFKFETFIDAYNGVNPLPTWNVTVNASNNTIRFTTATSPTQLDLSLVQVGDYVNIFGSEFNELNRGSFDILTVSVVYPLTQYFEVENIFGIADPGVVQSSVESIQFFRPSPKSIYSISPVVSAFAAQIEDGAVDVVLPATSIAVERQEFTGSYLQDYDTSVLTSLAQSYSMRNDANGIATGVLTSGVSHATGQNYSIQLKNLKPSYTRPTTTPGEHVVPPLTVDTSSMSIWSELASSPVGAYNSVGLTLQDKTVVNCGGVLPGGAAFTDEFSIFRFDGESVYSWDTGLMTGTRAGHAASVMLNDVAIMVTGGATNPATLAINTTEIIYANGGVSVATANMNAGRFSHAQVTLSDGKILVCGGLNAASIPIATVEVYDPLTNTWTNKASMNIQRYGHAAILLDDGKVLVSGRGIYSSSTEIYDPVGNTWTFVGNRTYSSREFKGQLIKLRDGRILAVGAYGYLPGHPATPVNHYISEFFDPVKKLWVKGPDLIPDGFYGDATDMLAVSVAKCEYVDEDFIIERVLVIQRDNSGSARTLRSQFLDIPNTATLKRYPLNRMELKWRMGPSFEAADNQEFFSLNASNGNSILLTHGLTVPGAVAAPSYLYIMGADEWGTANYTKNPYANLSSGTNFQTYNKEYRIPSAYDVLEAELTFMEAPDSDGIAGPYMWDPSGYSPAITDPQTTTTMDLNQGVSYSQITVASTAGFPDSGHLIFNFGYDDNFNGAKNLVYPVKYTAILSSTQIAIDPSFVFPYFVVTGSTVSPIYQLTAYDPENAASLGSLYLTDSPAGRVAAQNAINQITAAGGEINFEIKYPGGQGLGGYGFSVTGDGKKSDVVKIWSGGGDVDDT